MSFYDDIAEAYEAVMAEPEPDIVLLRMPEGMSPEEALELYKVLLGG